MARELPAVRRMSRRALGGLMLAVIGVAVGWSAFAWWRAWHAPLVTVMFRPTYSVEGIATGTPVRVQGVSVGQVASIGLEPDAEGRLRPLVSLSLDPAAMEDRGFADRLRGERLVREIAQGLRVRLVSVSPASGLLQVELVWDAAAPPPSEALRADEVPTTGASFRRRLEGMVPQMQSLAARDLVALVAELDRDLDALMPAVEPARAARFSAELVRRTAAVCAATDAQTLGAQSARLTDACARLRAAVERADRRFDDESLAILQVQLADAGAALASFAASLEGSQERLEGAATEFAGAFRAISEGARTWSRKAAGLTTEPLPR